jgi:hypothetical protein
MLGLTLIILGLNYQSTKSAEESAKAANESAKLALESVKWFKEPRPLITYSSNLDYLGYNKTLYLKIIPHYNGTKTTPWTWVVPIRISLYNSGRLPLMSAKLYINLTAENISTIFPFKIYKVVTPIDKLYYNEMDRKIYQTYKSIFWNQTVDIPIIPQDYPPYLINGEIMYPLLLHSIQTINEAQAFRQKVTQYGIYQKDKFGPFRIGTIKPNEKVDIEVWLFAISEGDYWEQLEIYWNKHFEESRGKPDPCEKFWPNKWEEFVKCIERSSYIEYKTGKLELIIESENVENPLSNKSYKTKPIKITFFLKSVF